MTEKLTADDLVSTVQVLSAVKKILDKVSPGLLEQILSDLTTDDEQKEEALRVLLAVCENMEDIENEWLNWKPIIAL